MNYYFNEETIEYPGRVKQIERTIELMKLEYDTDQFLEEDIEESILMELNII